MGKQSETLARPKNDFPATEYEGKLIVQPASFRNCRLASQVSSNISESSPHLSEPSQLERFEDHPHPLFADARRIHSRCQTSGFMIVHKAGAQSN